MFQLMRRSLKHFDADWGSTIAIPNASGRIYIEARNYGALTRLCKGLLNIYPKSYYEVPVEHRWQILAKRVFKPGPTVGSWIKVKFGRYARDVGMVTDVDDSGVFLTVKIPARVPSLKTNKRPLHYRRPLARLFTRSTAIKHFGIDKVSGTDPFAFEGHKYTADGFRLLRIRNTSTEPCRPTLRDVSLFLTAANERLSPEFTNTMSTSPTEIEIFAEASISPSEIALPSSIRAGQLVRITSGEFKDSYGIVTETPLQETAVIQVSDSTLSISTTDSMPTFSINTRQLLPVFELGDTVEVKHGLNAGKRGLVESTTDILVTIREGPNTDPVFFTYAV